MREFNEPQGWYKYVCGPEIREFIELCPEQSGQVMGEFLGVWEFL